MTSVRLEKLWQVFRRDFFWQKNFPQANKLAISMLILIYGNQKSAYRKSLGENDSLVQPQSIALVNPLQLATLFISKR